MAQKEVKRIELMYKILVITLVLVVFGSFIFIADKTITGKWYEKDKGRYSFAISAKALEDGKGNSIDIHGGGKAGMSGWILFQPVGGFDLTLVGTGSGTITLTTADGKKYSTNWEIAKSKFFALTDWYLLLKIKLKEPIDGLPQEFYLDLTEGAQPYSGTIILSTELPTLVDNELTPTGVITSGTGVVVIH